MLSLTRAWVQSLMEELRSHKPRSVAPQKKFYKGGPLASLDKIMFCFAFLKIDLNDFVFKVLYISHGFLKCHIPIMFQRFFW